MDTPSLDYLLKNKFYLRKNKKITFDIIILFSTILFIFIYFDYIEASEIIYAFSRKHEEYNLDEIILTIASSAFLFIIFILRRLFELKKLLKQVDTDPLIGIYNRRKGSQLIKSELDIISKVKRHASLIMFDIDDFKKVNDIYGHTIGDSVLINISIIINKIMRSNDSLIRWGGEEFMVLCPNRNLEESHKLALRFKHEIQKHKFKCNTTVTASFGVIELNTNEELRVQINNVDKKLYQSKREGKNRVT
jgi:diguanylate cyclase (GGDEF)-like protein